MPIKFLDLQTLSVQTFISHTLTLSDSMHCRLGISSSAVAWTSPIVAGYHGSIGHRLLFKRPAVVARE